MKIEHLKDLRAVLKLCHEQGVFEIEIDGIRMKIAEPAEKVNSESGKDAPNEQSYTDEELLTWSAGNG